MQISYLDPVRQQPVDCDHPEALARSIADSLPRGSQVKLLNQPFQLEPQILKSLLIHFEREQIPKHYAFSCQIAPAALSLDNCILLEKMAFKTLSVPLDVSQCDLAQLEQMLLLTRQFDFEVIFQLQGSTTPAPAPLTDLYFFLRDWMGNYTLDYTFGYFEQASIDFRFRFLRNVSGPCHAGRRTEALVHRHYYLGLQEFLRLKLSSRAQQILELNPWGRWQYYADFNRAHQSWRTTLLDLPAHQLPQQLEHSERTFDAVVLFQALPSLRDPRAAVEQLRRLSRTTTEWVVFEYNFSTLPSLAQLANNQFSSDQKFKSWWPYPQPQTLKRTQQLLTPLKLELEWIPTRLPLKGMEPLIQQFDASFSGEYTSLWQAYRQQADVLAWTAYGSGQLLPETTIEEGFAEGFVEGFI
ncbi:MAG: hypothetical protein IGS03_05025 [Candidatus Sericytochromatia bacterium]|nr:hypothetical protein [Candidatus Sericytochromatia bacterium]